MKTTTADLPSALSRRDEILRLLGDRRPAVFLDYDGTLTPIVERPEDALLPEDTRRTIRSLAERCAVAVISGRDLRDVRDLVGIDSVCYAGSHGFEIAGPSGSPIAHDRGREFLDEVGAVEETLRSRLRGIDGARVERKRYSVAVHFRQVRPEDKPAVDEVVDAVLRDHPKLRSTAGKEVRDLQPDIDWDKGKAVFWLLEALGLDGGGVLPLYIGDDVTDEDAFRALADRGVAIVVRDGPRPTAARWALEDPGEVRRFLEALVAEI